MSLSKPVNKLFATLTQAYFMYKGMYEGDIEIRIEGREGLFGDNRYTKLFVRVYWNGHRMGGFSRPFTTMRTARKYAGEEVASLNRFTASALRDGWAPRADYNAHVPEYRNYRADRGLSYFDYRRKDGPFVHGDMSDCNDHVGKYQLFQRRYVPSRIAA